MVAFIIVSESGKRKERRKEQKVRDAFHRKPHERGV
jgi:hypothetical protein